MSRIYGKLVRDKIPAIIESHNEEPVCRILEGSELNHRVKLKIKEELDELLTASSSEEELLEFADLYEILDTYRKLKGFTAEEVNQARKEKSELRGKFSKGIYLVSVREPRSEEQITRDIEADTIMQHLRTAKHKNTTITLEVQKGAIQVSKPTNEG